MTGTVAKFREVKTWWSNLGEVKQVRRSSKEGYGPKSTALSPTIILLLSQQALSPVGTVRGAARVMCDRTLVIPYKTCVRFAVFTAVTMKNGVFWDVTPRGSCKNRRFGGT
jgi:hypothetical protein